MATPDDGPTLHDGRRVFHFWIDDEVLDTYGPLIGPFGIAVYVYLARRAKVKQSFPAYGTIAKETGMSRRKAISTIHALEAQKLIAIETRLSESGDPTSNRYVIQDLSHLHARGSAGGAPPSAGGAPGVVQEVHQGSAGGAPPPYIRSEVFPLKDSHSEEETPPPKSPQGETHTRTKAAKQPGTNYTAGFEHMWQSYPSVRKERKVATFAIWHERGLEPRAAEIAEKLERLQVTLWEGREKKYIPMPTTWFNDSRYEDELVSLETTNGQQDTRLGKAGMATELAIERLAEKRRAHRAEFGPLLRELHQGPEDDE